MFEQLREEVTTLHERLRSQGQSLSVAESCTGGMLGGAVTSVAGSSDVFEGGGITYSNNLKKRLLDVDVSTLEQHGAVSAPVAREMAQGAVENFESSCAVGVTGIAGPSGGTPEKPVGLVHFGFWFPETLRHERRTFEGDRETVRFQSVKFAIKILTEFLTDTNK